MSYQGKLQRCLSADRVDITLAKIGVVACVLLLGLRLLTAQVLLVIIPTATGAACVLYLSVQNRHSAPLSGIRTGLESPPLLRVMRGYFPPIVFAILTGTVLLTHLGGGRTVPVHLLIGVIGVLILAQILLVDDDSFTPGAVLVQIVVATVVIRMSTLFFTPGFIGVDIWTHVPTFIEGIAEAGSLAAISESKYIMAPIYHTIGAIAALVFDSARTGVYLTVGLLMPLSVLFVYATAKLLVPVRWALLATALYAFADQFVLWGLHVIPTSLGLVFFLGALYCVTKLFYTDDLWAIGLLFTFSLATVFTHQVSTAIVLVFLLIGSVSVLLVRLSGEASDKAPLRSVIGLVSASVVTLLVTIVSWMNTPWFGNSPFLWQMVEILEGTLASEAGFLNLAGGNGAGGGAGGEMAGDASGEDVGLLAEFVPFIDWLGFALLLLIAVVGGLAMLRTRDTSTIHSRGYGTDSVLTYLATAATLFVIVFGFSLFGIRDILPGRWMGFMYALFAIIGAIGLYHISRNASSRVVLVVFIVVAVGYPMTMVVAEKATIDSPAFEEEHPRFSYTDSEITAVETINTIYSPETDRGVVSDHPYQSLFGRYGGYSSSTVELDEVGVTEPEPVIYRDYQTQGATVFYGAGEPPYRISSRTVASERVCSPLRNHVYANDAVRMCSSSAVEPGVNA